MFPPTMVLAEVQPASAEADRPFGVQVDILILDAALPEPALRQGLAGAEDLNIHNILLIYNRTEVLLMTKQIEALWQSPLFRRSRYPPNPGFRISAAWTACKEIPIAGNHPFYGAARRSFDFYRQDAAPGQPNAAHRKLAQWEGGTAEGRHYKNRRPAPEGRQPGGWSFTAACCGTTARVRGLYGLDNPAFHRRARRCGRIQARRGAV